MTRRKCLYSCNCGVTLSVTNIWANGRHWSGVSMCCTMCLMHYERRVQKQTCQLHNLASTDWLWIENIGSFKVPGSLSWISALNYRRKPDSHVPVQVLTTLRLVGSFQTGQVFQSSRSRAMPAVWDSLIRIKARYNNSPTLQLKHCWCAVTCFLASTV